MARPRVRDLQLLVGAGAVTFAAAWVILNHRVTLGKPLLMLGVMTVTVAQVRALRWRSGVGLPAAAVAIVGVNLVGVTGYLFYRQLAPQAQVSAALPETGSVYLASARIFAVASLGLWAGAMLIGRSKHGIAPSLNVRQVAQSMSPRLVLLVGTIPLLLTVAGYTPGALILRNQYLHSYGPRDFVSAGSLFTPVAVAVLAFASADRRRPFGNRAAAVLLLVIYSIVLFAVGTRQLCLIPILFFVGWRMNPADPGRPHRFAAAKLAGTAGVALLLVQLPLSLRGGVEAGWVPFFQRIADQPGIIFQIRPGAIFGNILFGFPLAGTILRVAGGTLSLHVFMTSINPLPGQFTDWTSLLPRLGLNQATPFNGLGELAVYGWAYLALLPAVIACVLTLCQRAAQKLPSTAATIMSLATLGVAAVFTLDLLQYNLRSGLRPVWYLVALSLAVRALNQRIEVGAETPGGVIFQP